MKKVSIIILASLTFTWSAVKAQDITKDSIAVKIAKNTIFFELGGNGIVYTINYDRVFFKKNNYHMSARVGFSWMPLEGIAIFVPMLINSTEIMH